MILDAISRQRLFAGFDMSGQEQGDCWPWLRATSGAGYGQLHIEGVTHYTHRLMFQLEFGELGAGQCALHRCDNPPCGRPTHLFAGTRTDNMLDKVAKGRQTHGSHAAMAKLDEARVARILARYAVGDVSALALARANGVTESTLRAIVNGITWKHVDGPRLTRADIVALGKRNRAEAVREAKQRQ